MGKYCIFSSNYLPNVGGVEVYTEKISLELAKRGNQVVIVTNNLFSLPQHEMLSDAISIIRFPCIPLVGGRFPLRKGGPEFSALWKLLLDDRFDGVLVNTRFYQHSLLGMAFARKQGLTPVVIDHGSDYLTFGNAALDVFVRIFEQAITRYQKIRYAPDYYGVSLQSAEWLRAFGIKAKGVLSGAIDGDGYRRSSSGRDFRKEHNLDVDVKICSFIGRFIPEKGVKQVLLSARRFFEDGENVHFFFAGAGALEEVVKSCGLSNVTFLGRLDSSDVAALLCQTDIFCGLSRSEGFGYSMLEAAVCGAYLVITKVGIADALCPSKEYGRIVSSLDDRELTEAIQWGLANPEEMKRASLLCQSRASVIFSWSKAADDLLVAFES